MLPVADQKEQVEKMIRDSSDSYLPNKHNMAREYRRRNLHSSMGELFIIGRIKTKVDIIWQNGEHTFGSDPHNLVPVNVINTHEFWPHQFVMEKGTSDSDDDKSSSNQRWGVVLSFDAKEHTVNVQWRTVPASEPGDFAGETTMETVSAYELVEHPDFSCCFGDIVFKAAQKQLGYLAEKNYANSMSDLNAEAPLKNLDQIGYQNKSHHLSCIGNVTGFKDGHVEVKWATGLTTKVCHFFSCFVILHYFVSRHIQEVVIHLFVHEQVAPYEIFRVDKHEGSTATPVSYETNIEELAQEIVEHGILPSEQKVKVRKKNVIFQ
jgi:ubiquitin-conjugating enzyme E2 O